MGPTDWIGQDKITPPFGGNWNDPGSGLEAFINNGFRLAFVAFGLYSLLNFVMAAFNYINAQGETKNIEKAKNLLGFKPKMPVKEGLANLLS